MKQNIINAMCSVLKQEDLLLTLEERELKRYFNEIPYLYHSIISHSFGVIVVVDLAGNITYVNKAFNSVLGMNSSTGVGKNFYQVFNRGNFSKDVFAEALINDTGLHIIKINLNISKTLNFETVVYTKILFNQQGKAIGVFSFWTNQTDNVYLAMKQITSICLDSIINNPENLERLSQIVDTPYLWNQSHSRNVTIYTGMIASALNMLPTDKNKLLLASLLHDIGKSKIPPEILNKPGKLTTEEFKIMMQHPEMGKSLIKDIPALSSITNVVCCHHERYDGRGYPFGMVGQEIPFESRVISIADSFDAMVSNRPYKTSISIDDAVAELQRCAGTQFDPHLINIFTNCLAKTSG